MDTVARPSRRRWRWLVTALVGALAATLLAGSVSTWAWGSSLREDGRMLPGTTIASVDVSSMSVDEARGAVEDLLAEQLDRTLRVTHGDLTVETTARDLGTSTDLDQVLADATERTSGAGFRELVRARWFGADGQGRDVAIDLDHDQIATFVADVAERIDRDATDADVEVDGDTLAVNDAVEGREVDQAAATDALAAAAGDPDADAELELTVAATAPQVDTETATRVAETTRAVVDAALDRPVTVTLDGDRREVTARDLGASVDREALVDAGFDGADIDRDDVEVSVSDDALRGVVDELAAGKETAARDASFAVVGTDFEVTSEQVGAAVDRAAAVTSLRSALAGGPDEVSLELDTVRPTVTSDAFDTVIVLERSARTVSLHRDGERTHRWPVAVGASSSPTPTGRFTVGAKRFEPTWVNPAPDRWGADLPARVGPGPDNPLGVRAINWNNSAGGDTLIRFHGTPNEDSIGSATSNGCVRMFNEDVIELYDLVSTGTMIVSVD